MTPHSLAAVSAHRSAGSPIRREPCCRSRARVERYARAASSRPAVRPPHARRDPTRSRRGSAASSRAADRTHRTVTSTGMSDSAKSERNALIGSISRPAASTTTHGRLPVRQPRTSPVDGRAVRPSDTRSRNDSVMLVRPRFAGPGRTGSWCSQQGNAARTPPADASAATRRLTSWPDRTKRYATGGSSAATPGAAPIGGSGARPTTRAARHAVADTPGA